MELLKRTGDKGHVTGVVLLWEAQVTLFIPLAAFIVCSHYWPLHLSPDTTSLQGPWGHRWSVTGMDKTPRAHVKEMVAAWAWSSRPPSRIASGKMPTQVTGALNVEEIWSSAMEGVGGSDPSPTVSCCCSPSTLPLQAHLPLLPLFSRTWITGFFICWAQDLLDSLAKNEVPCTGH